MPKQKWFYRDEEMNLVPVPNMKVNTSSITNAISIANEAVDVANECNTKINNMSSLKCFNVSDTTNYSETVW